MISSKWFNVHHSLYVDHFPQALGTELCRVIGTGNPSISAVDAASASPLGMDSDMDKANIAGVSTDPDVAVSVAHNHGEYIPTEQPCPSSPESDTSTDSGHIIITSKWTARDGTHIAKHRT